MIVIPLVLVFFLVEREQENPIFQINGQAAIRETGESEGLWHFSRVWLGVLLVPCCGSGVDLHPRRVVSLVISLMVLGFPRGSLRFRQLVVTIPAVVAVVLLTFSSVLDRLEEVADPNSTFFGRIEMWSSPEIGSGAARSGCW